MMLKNFQFWLVFFLGFIVDKIPIFPVIIGIIIGVYLSNYYDTKTIIKNIENLGYSLTNTISDFSFSTLSNKKNNMTTDRI